MALSTLGTALETTVFLSTAASLAVAWLVMSRPASALPARRHSRRLDVFFHPLAQLLLVCLLLYVNQVLFGAFILRAHGGSVAFIARFIPGPWFAIGHHDPLVRLVAPHVGDGQWLAPSLLRVQAFLELPFTMFAYLAVARLLGRRLQLTLCRLPILLLVAVSFSITFSTIELGLPNPYTHDDVVLRAISCVVAPVYVAWTSRRERAVVDDGPSGVLGLLTFLAGAGAIAYVVLALYDALLLYNLARLPRYATGLVVASAVALLASVMSSRIDVLVRSGAPATLAGVVARTILQSFTLLFFVPSLSLRYWGAHASALFCGLSLIAIAIIAGLAHAVRQARAPWSSVVRVVLSLPFALLAGGVAAAAALATMGVAALPELVLARIALSFLAVTIVVFRGLEIAVCWALHETKARPDEA